MSSTHYYRVIMAGYRKPLTTDDVWELEDRDLSETVGGVFRKIWSEELKKSK